MRIADLAIAASLAAIFLPAAALAADMDVPPPNAGANYAACPPAPVQAQPRQPAKNISALILRRRGAWVQPPRVVTVEPFDGVHPGRETWIQPQTAYLASSRCPPSLGWSPGGSWYDGKTFYYDGPTPHRPDTFMIVVEPSQAHLPRIYKRTPQQ